MLYRAEQDKLAGGSDGQRRGAGEQPARRKLRLVRPCFYLGESLAITSRDGVVEVAVNGVHQAASGIIRNSAMAGKLRHLK